MLDTLDEAEAVRQADEAAHRRADMKPVIERLPPVVSIVSPLDGSVLPPGPVEIRYTVRLPSGGTLDRVEAFVDGAKVEARGLAPPTRPTPDGDVGSLFLPMPDHDTAISLVAYAGGKAGDAARVTFKAAPPSRPAVPALDPDALKPNLYALVVGVSAYDDTDYALAYPAIDADGFAAALKGQEGRLYHHVVVEVLTDHEATATGIKRGLTWLAKQATDHDLAVVFAAGHGMTDAKGKFWFLSSDMDPANVSATAVSQDDIEDVLFDMPGKKLLFLDACHAGAALNAAVLNAGARGGIDVSAAVSDFSQTEGGVVAYAASTGRELSFERDDWGHGAFTKALIEGFGGSADIMHDGTITTGTLDLFVERRVKELTGDQQHPVMTRPKTVPDFRSRSCRFNGTDFLIRCRCPTRNHLTGVPFAALRLLLVAESCREPREHVIDERVWVRFSAEWVNESKRREDRAPPDELHARVRGWTRTSASARAAPTVLRPTWVEKGLSASDWMEVLSGRSIRTDPTTREGI